MSLIEKMIRDKNFEYLQPYFYNNRFAYRCELGIGETEKEYAQNSRKRALKIYNILFPKGADAVIFNYWEYDYFCGEEPDLSMDVKRVAADENKQLLHFLEYRKKYRHSTVKNLKTCASPQDEDFEKIRRHRIICYADGKQFDYEKIIDEQINEKGFETGFVSFENECIFSVYDDRGCDIVFASKEKMKGFYSVLEKYFLRNDLEEIQRKLKD